jgi:hypothetical protein
MASGIDDAEIARFRDNLDCHLPDCDWHEDRSGAAWCEVCGSGYLPSARAFLAKLYARRAQRDLLAMEKMPGLKQAIDVD